MIKYLLIITVWIALYAIPLFLHPLHEPDEARYGEISREMSVSDDWLVLRLNGMPYPEKPPMFFWLTASGFKIFGAKIWVGRMVSALGMLLLSLILFATTKKLIGEKTALFAAIIALAQVAVMGVGQLCITDPLFSAFVGITVLFSVRTVLSESQKSYWLFGLAASIFLGCAILTKGPAAIILSGGIVGLWAIFSKKFKKLLVFALNPVFWCIVVVIVASYYYFAEKRLPGLTNYFFVHENFLRYLTKIHKRGKPFWFFPLVFFGGMMPWTILMPFAAHFYYKNKAAWKKNRKWLLLSIFWAVLPIAFFSLSSSKLIPYILLSFSGTGLFFGIWLTDLDSADSFYYDWLRHKIKLLFSFFSVVLAISACVFAVLICLITKLSRHLNPSTTFIVWCTLAAIICLTIALIIYFTNWKSIQKIVIIVSVVLLLALGLVLRATNFQTGHPNLIKNIVKLTHPEDIVVQYAIVKNAVPFALNRKIISVLTAGDMKYAIGTNWPCEPNVWLDQQEFIDLFTNKTPVLAILKSKHLIWLKNIKTIQLEEDRGVTLISNPAYLKVHKDQ